MVAKKKTNNDILINVLLDRSGSMVHLAPEVISHYNAYIDEQRKEEGKTLVSLVLFDDVYEEVYIGVDVHEVKPLTKDTYYTRGMTAYLDALGRFIKSIDAIKNKPDKVVVLINTDGLENASRTYVWSQIKELVQERTNNHNWQFVFVTAGLDKETVDRVTRDSGFDFNNVLVASASPAGMSSTYSNFTQTLTSYRTGTSKTMNVADNVSATDQDIQTLTPKTKKKTTPITK